MIADRLLVATRNRGKLRELQEIFGERAGIELVDLTAIGLAEEPHEDTIEAFDTFAENALAKARYFAARSGLPTLADDSGLCVDALGGAPGVHSKRFAGRNEGGGAALDRANNALLLERLAAVPTDRRGARFVCALALVEPLGAERVFVGRCTGTILSEGRGTSGFGYDPLFLVPSLGATFAELSREMKNAISHRAVAARAAAAAISGQPHTGRLDGVATPQ